MTSSPTSCYHCNDVMISAVASQITSLTIVYSTVYSGADQREHQGSASLVFVQGIHGWPANSPHKRPVTRKMFPFDNVSITMPQRHVCILYHYSELRWHRQLRSFIVKYKHLLIRNSQYHECWFASPQHRSGWIYLAILKFEMFRPQHQRL